MAGHGERDGDQAERRQRDGADARQRLHRVHAKPGERAGARLGEEPAAGCVVGQHSEIRFSTKRALSPSRKRGKRAAWWHPPSRPRGHAGRACVRRCDPPMRSACRRRLLHSRCGRVCPGLWTGRKAPCVPRGNGAAPCGKPVPDPAEFLSLDAWLAAVLARLRDERTTAAVGPVGQSLSVTARAHRLTAKEYIETVAQELGRVRGRGLLLSPADAQLALSWHASRVPLAAVIAEVRRAARLRARTAGVRGAAEMLVSLQAIAPAIDRLTARRPPPPPKPEGLRAQLRAAAQAPGLAARAAWESLADAARAARPGAWAAAVRT